MALTKAIQAVFQGSPVSGTYQPVASEVTTLLTELSTSDGSNPQINAGRFLANSSTGASGYTTGAGGTVTQATSRTTGVTLDTPCGAITLFSAAGSATPAQFTLTNSKINQTDVVSISQRSGLNTYAFSTKAAVGSCVITFWSLIGTASDTPILNFSVNGVVQS